MERMTTDYAQYLLLSQIGECVPQKAIRIMTGDRIEVTADNGKFYFIFEGGKIRRAEDWEI